MIAVVAAAGCLREQAVTVQGLGNRIIREPGASATVSRKGLVTIIPGGGVTAPEGGERRGRRERRGRTAPRMASSSPSAYGLRAPRTQGRKRRSGGGGGGGRVFFEGKGGQRTQNREMRGPIACSAGSTAQFKMAARVVQSPGGSVRSSCTTPGGSDKPHCAWSSEDGEGKPGRTEASSSSSWRPEQYM